MPSIENPDSIIFSTQQVAEWRENRGRIQPAPWLTEPLVNSGLLPEDARRTGIAPVVIGIGMPILKRTCEDPREGYLAINVGTDALSRPHANGDFNVHAPLKNTARKQLESSLIPRELTRRKKPDITLFAGYALPHLADGTVYLEGFESDELCSKKRLLPAGAILVETFDLQNVFVGEKPVRMNEFGTEPLVSLPAVIRNALNYPEKGLSLDARIRSCTRYLLEIEQ